MQFSKAATLILKLNLHKGRCKGLLGVFSKFLTCANKEASRNYRCNYMLSKDNGKIEREQGEGLFSLKNQ